jgi:Tfp pilus assembly protein PilN
MQVKTQKQVMALQNKAQKVADKLNEEVIVIAKGVQLRKIEQQAQLYNRIFVTFS